MPRRAKRRVIGGDERAIDHIEALGAILQGLGEVVAGAEGGALGEQEVELGPDAVAGVVGADALDALDDGDGHEPPRQVQELLLEPGRGRLPGQPRYVLQAGLRPVDYYEQGEDAGARGLQVIFSDYHLFVFCFVFFEGGRGL